MDKLLDLQKLDAKHDDSGNHHSCNSGLDPDGDK